MSPSPKILTKSEASRVQRTCPVVCAWDQNRIENLADFVTVVSAALSDDDGYWFRGHRDVSWDLRPAALRFASAQDRRIAQRLLDDFQRVAEIKLSRPPGRDKRLQWMQLAQHYGIPTRLLDWTYSATFALFFACMSASRADLDVDGVVFILNPENVSTMAGQEGKSSLDAIEDDDVRPYLQLGIEEQLRGRGLPTIAINPVWNSERLMVQRGAFTLHGSHRFSLDREQAPSLYAIPILAAAKKTMLLELARIGVDEMTLFPELEHACAHLKRRAGLEGAR